MSERSQFLRLVVGLAFTVAASSAPLADDAVEATIPVEVLAVDPALATGLIKYGLRWDEPRAAAQPARIARAIVTQPTSGKGALLILALLGRPQPGPDGRANLDVAPAGQAWCEYAPFEGLTINCFQDVDGDGKLETQRRGLLGSNELLSLNRIEKGVAIAPVAYRRATDQELPGYIVGYYSCGERADASITAETEIRIATLVKRVDGLRFPPAQICNDVAKRVGATSEGDPLFQFGRFRIAVRQVEDRKFETRLIDGMAPGTLLGQVRADWPLRDVTERPADADAISGETPFLVAVGAPTLAATAGVGEEFFSVQVRHGITGKLTADSTLQINPHTVVPAGSPLYGIAMSSSHTASTTDPRIVWCAPRQNEAQKLVSQCFMPVPRGYSFSESEWMPYGVESVYGSLVPDVSPPIVQHGPVDFGALFLRLKYIVPAKPDRKYLHIMWTVGPESEPIWREKRVRRSAKGAGVVMLGELLLELIPDPAGTAVTVTPHGEITAGEAVDLPLDAVQLMRR